MGGQDIIKIPRACRKRIESFFHNIDPKDLFQYLVDWQTIMPNNELEELNRYRFAYCTVHTPWLRSCEQYNTIKSIKTDTTYNTIMRILKNTSGGMFTIKAEGITNLHQQWKYNRSLFKPDKSDWQSWRDTVANRLDKLGLAKTSFAIEMIRPLDAQCICIDRHMFKAFGWENVDLSCSATQYRYYEKYWLDLSNQHNIPPVISRNMFWDKIQNQQSSMYWANYII